MNFMAYKTYVTYNSTVVQRESEPLSAAVCGALSSLHLHCYMINILQHWKLKLVCVSWEKNQKSNCLWTQSRGMFCFSSGFFLLFLVNISCPSWISLTSFLGHQRKLPQKIKNMSFMTFSYKWGHIKWLLLPFLWKCHQSKNIYPETIFSSHFIWFPWH